MNRLVVSLDPLGITQLPTVLVDYWLEVSAPHGVYADGLRVLAILSEATARPLRHAASAASALGARAAVLCALAVTRVALAREHPFLCLSTLLLLLLIDGVVISLEEAVDGALSALTTTA